MKFFKTVLFVIIGFVFLTCLFFGYKDIPLEELKEKYAQEPSAFLEMDGMEVHYRDEGSLQDTIPLVLIHGTGSSLHTFDDWALVLKKERRVIRMDIPAFGLTGPFPDRDYSIEKYVIFIKHFLEARGVEKCIIGGNSLGGQIAWNFTVKHSEMVDKLVLIDAVGYPLVSKSVPLAFRIARTPVLNKALTFITPRFMAKASVENVYADKSKVTEDLVDRYFELTLRAGNRLALGDRMTRREDYNTVPEIKNIEQPTLILWGEEDMLDPVSYAYKFHEDLPNDTLVIMPKTGHVPMEESPAESLEVLLDFLNN